jgi:hypothetical protein
MNWLRPEPFPDLQIAFRLFPNPNSLSNPLFSCIAVTGFITYGIMGLQFRLQYKKGTSNTVADALSHGPDTCAGVSAATAQPTWLDRLQAGYKDDVATRSLIMELSITGSNDQGYSFKDGVIRHKDRIWVGNNALAQNHILQALHNSGIGGHSGVQATYHRAKQYFSWPHMKKTVQTFVAGCQVCQQAKPEPHGCQVCSNHCYYLTEHGHSFVWTSSKGSQYLDNTM